MSRRWFLIAPLALGLLAAGAPGRAPGPDDPKPEPKPAAPKAADTIPNPENIEAAYKLGLAAAAEYEIRVGGEKKKPLELLRESKLKWSDPAHSDVQGNLFLWTRDGRPQVVGCIYKWFAPVAQMEHEFHSFAEEPLSATFHGKPVWKTGEAGVKFVDVPDASAPAANEAQRVLQLRQLAKEFSATAKYRKDTNDTELRLLPQPIHRYAVPQEGVLNGGLFAFVRGTDPELLLLIEARGKDVSTARWQFAATRMTAMAELKLGYQKKQVWQVGLLTRSDIVEKHELVYTVFKFNTVPDFLKDAVEKPKP
jgi:hypothetical protein